jgi:hypothetical protein
LAGCAPHITAALVELRTSSNLKKMPVKTASAPLVARDTVLAKVAMKGVPEGTTGKIIHVQGLSWTRYWVWFDNGVRLGTIDRAKLATPAEWATKLAGADAVAVVAGAAAAVTGGAGASGALESVNGVPGLLIERSRLARERWAAKKG